MADPSVAGARQALFDQLTARFPSVPEETIRLIIIQHSNDPEKCWDLVRLENSRPTAAEQSTSNYSNGGIIGSRTGDRYFQYPTSAIMRPSGSYVLRRSGASSPQPSGVVRDSRSCTPPRQQPSPNSGVNSITRPQTLPIRPVINQRSPSPRPSMTQDSGVHSYPGTPTGGGPPVGPKTSLGYGGMLPALKINYQLGGSQILVSPSPTPASPTFVLSSQPSLVSRPMFYHLTRTTSQQPPGAPAGSTGTPVFQYDRRPSFADVELAQRASSQQLPSSNLSAYFEPLRVSADNLNEATTLYPASPRGATMAVVSSSGQGPPLYRTPANYLTGSNIRIQLDPSGGAVISDGGRQRPRVTFVQQQPRFTFSLKQATPQSQTYDGRALVNSMALTQAKAQECLKSSLTHQRSRLADMKKAMGGAKTRLQELRMDVDQMEQDLFRRRKHSVRSEAIGDETVTSLHKETRELQASIRTMLQELEKLNLDNQTTAAAAITLGAGLVGEQALLNSRKTGHGQQLRVDVAKAECEIEGSCEAEQWSCSYCTFKNHTDLPVCECCEMPRVTDVDGWQLVYDISPSAFAGSES